jgi:hypothetical protein
MIAVTVKRVIDSARELWEIRHSKTQEERQLQIERRQKAIPVLPIVIIVIVVLLIVGLSYLLSLNWNTIVFDQKRITTILVCFLFLLLGICVQITYMCWHDERDLSSVKPREIVFPLFYSIVLFCGIWSQLDLAHDLRTAAYTSFVSGFTFKTLFRKSNIEDDPLGLDD